ncbi:MAG: hypothetical protein JW896_03540 [Deltaproteobacteria bacterium]|nr:hypothetical protein [Deltaproteobacteria bacterium]
MDIHNNVVESWREHLSNMEESLDILEKGLKEAEEMTEICTDEWCTATEHVIDDLSNWLFSISEPGWASDEDTRKLKSLKRRLHDLYAKYKGTSNR